jgi:hypothetical protein
MAGRELRATTSTAFDTALETVRGLLAQVARDESKTRYRIGTLLREVSGSIETYGARAVERLAERLEVGADTLYRCISVAETWSEPELKALTARTNRRGEPLTWSHLATLAKIPGERTRGRWIERCIEAGWTTRELAQELLGERGRDHDAWRLYVAATSWMPGLLHMRMDEAGTVFSRRQAGRGRPRPLHVRDGLTVRAPTHDGRHRDRGEGTLRCDAARVAGGDRAAGAEAPRLTAPPEKGRLARHLRDGSLALLNVGLKPPSVSGAARTPPE